MREATTTAACRARRKLPREPQPLGPLVGARLRFALQEVHDRIVAALAAARFHGLVHAHLKVLRYPPPDGERPSALARRAKTTKQAMNYLLVQLEDLGYVRRRAKPGTRTRLVHLTARGWRVAALQRETVRALEAEWSARVGAKRFATFEAVLRELTDERPDSDERE